MKSLSGPIWDLWNTGGPFLGDKKPNGYVTVEFGWVLRESTGPVGDRDPKKLPIRWWQRADWSQEETILPNVKSLHIDRSVDTDAATADLVIYNQMMLPQQLLELGNPGWFTYGRGDHPDSLARWGHEPNEWSVEMTPNALIRTYEGYGGYNPDGSQMDLMEALAGEFVTQSGAWLIDELRPTTDAMLSIRCRDMGKLLVDQPLYPPLVPAASYPLSYARFFWRHVETPYIAYGVAAGGVKIIVGLIADAGNDGYWLVGDDGGVFTYGDNFFHGSLSGDVSHGVIGGARSSKNEGYWLATKHGEVFAFGDATWFPPMVGVTDHVGIEAIETVDGYYLVDTGGHVYAAGGAAYHGGGPGTTPIVGMAALRDGSGYVLLDSTGHVYAYGAATYYGNGNPAVGSPYTSIELTETGLGYWLTTKRGHVFAFGDAEYHGGTAILVLNDPISDMVRRPDGLGYWLVAEDGGVFTFGPISFYGSLPGATANDFPYDGNYFDYTDIIKDLCLWAGLWLKDSITGGQPDVFGNLETTGAYGPYDLPTSMFGYNIDTGVMDKRAPSEVINQIKEIVGFVTWFDTEGGFHFESPNWWQEGNFLLDGTHVTVLPEIDERVQLINYGVSTDDKAARDRVIITDADPTQQIPDSHTTVVNITPNVLRGLLKPAMWQNYLITKPEEQAKMASLLGRQLVFLQRVGSVVCWANPLMEVNDQCRIWERITDEVYDHYIRGISTDHDFETGEYTMHVTTHWLGRDWGGRGPDRNLNIGSARSDFEAGEFDFAFLATPEPAGFADPGGFGQPTVVGPQARSMAALSSSFAAGGPTVSGATVLFLDDFANMGAWSAGGFSISPAGFAYHAGDGSGNGMAQHTKDAGTVYVEMLAYGDATGGDNWAVLKLDCNGGQTYDWNGIGLVFRSTNGDVFVICNSDATVTVYDPAWTLPSVAMNLGRFPRNLGTAVLLGIHKISTGVYDIYVDRVRMARYSGVSAALGPNIGIAGYNGIGVHIDYLAAADGVLTSDPR